ncbi:MAG: hypothetical protein ACRD5M_05060 [Candidatus Acidiferrales bacterium]
MKNESAIVLENLQEAKAAIAAIDEQTADHIKSGAVVSFRHSTLVGFSDNLRRAQEAVASALKLAEQSAAPVVVDFTDQPEA